MKNIINRLKDMLCGSKIDGYILMIDDKNNKTFVLVKNGDNFWKTEWVNNKQIKINQPAEPISSIFKRQVNS